MLQLQLLKTFAKHVLEKHNKKYHTSVPYKCTIPYQYTIPVYHTIQVYHTITITILILIIITVMTTGFPSWTASSKVGRQLASASFIIFKSLHFSISAIHLSACRWGSINNGHFREFFTSTALCMELLSCGNELLNHLFISIGFVRNSVKSKFLETGMSLSRQAWYHCENSSLRKECEKAPE